MRQQISFKSRIEFVSYDNFNKLQEAHNPKSAQMGLFPAGGKTVGTNYMANCIGGSLNSDKFAFGFHYANTHGLSYDERWIPLCKTTFGDDTPVKGFLTGGYDEGTPILEYFSELFKKLGIKHSIISGRIGGWEKPLPGKTNLATNWFYSIKNDTHYVASVFDNNINSPAKLLKAFKVVHIEDGDELIIGGKEVSKPMIKKIHEIVTKRLAKSKPLSCYMR